MPKLTFSVDAPPIAKARPRVVNRHTYTPERTRGYEALIGAHAREAMNMAGLTMAEKGVPVRVDFGFYITMWSSWSITKKMKMQGTLRSIRPDFDNYEKAIIDACNGIVYHDDGQISVWSGSKRWAGISEEGRVNITFEWGEHLD